MSGAGITLLAAMDTDANAEGACAQLNRFSVSFRDEIPIAMGGNEVMSGSGITELTATKSRASRKPEETPVSLRDEDPIAVEGNEVRSTRPPAELILKASGEPLLEPIVDLFNTLAEPSLDATAEPILLAESDDSDPDQYKSESKPPRGIASALATSW
ncbi:hypothetical protein K438DRAFT_1956388 [Mycena galopus ATCC 62051]|nr:hypothetical protein K438DRAFT_1956388 [Mycena galopus ATCC 62051]